MKFYIERRSVGGGEESEPSRYAFPTVHEKMHKVIWCIDVKSIEDLMALQREVGHPLTINRGTTARSWLPTYY